MIYSKQREIILKTLKGLTSHPTADDLYALIKAEEPSISLATVYRNLNQLADRGVIQRVTMCGGADRFDGNAAMHVHMRCEACGKVLDVHEVELPDLCAIMNAQTDLNIRTYALIFHGECNICKQRLADEAAKENLG